MARRRNSAGLLLHQPSKSFSSSSWFLYFCCLSNNWCCLSVFITNSWLGSCQDTWMSTHERSRRITWSISILNDYGNGIDWHHGNKHMQFIRVKNMLLLDLLWHDQLKWQLHLLFNGQQAPSPLPFSLWISLVILLGRRKNMNTTACLCVVILDDRSGNTYAIFVGVVGDNGKPSLEGRSSSVNDGCAMSSTNEEQFFFLPYIVHYILQGGQAHKWLLMKEKFEWFCRSQLLLATSGNLYMFVCLFFVFKEGKLIVFFWF